MATSKTPSAYAEAASTTILLKGFPLATHREMKGVAARAGIRVSDAYAQACDLYLERLARRTRGKRS